MGDASGFRVMRLARTEFAGITSEGLRPGEWRYLTADELTTLKADFGVPKRVVSPPRAPPPREPPKRVAPQGREPAKRAAPSDRQPSDRESAGRGPSRRGTRPDRESANRGAPPGRAPSRRGAPPDRESANRGAPPGRAPSKARVHRPIASRSNRGAPPGRAPSRRGARAPERESANRGASAGDERVEAKAHVRVTSDRSVTPRRVVSGRIVGHRPIASRRRAGLPTSSAARAMAEARRGDARPTFAKHWGVRRTGAGRAAHAGRRTRRPAEAQMRKGRAAVGGPVPPAPEEAWGRSPAGTIGCGADGPDPRGQGRDRCSFEPGGHDRTDR